MSSENNNVISDIAEDVAKETEVVSEGIEEAAETAAENADAAADKADDIKEEVADKIEDAKESAADKAKDIKEEVTDKIEDAKDAVAERVDDIKEDVTDKIDDVKEAVTEKASEVKASASDKIQDIKKAVPAKKSSVKQPEIKKKSGVNKTTLITIIVCAVVVLACVGFVGYKLGWFHVPTKASMTMDDYSTIEVSSGDLEVADSTVDSYLSAMQTYYQTTETQTEGTIEEGDKIHIVYTGYLDGVAFDGGSTGDSGTDITVGSSGYIDGFDDGLIGMEIGETKDLELTFPDEYNNNPDLAGQDVIFTVTVESREITNTPELTDDFIKENSADYTLYYYDEATQIDTVEDYHQFVYDKIYNAYFKNAEEEALVEKVHVKSYDEVHYNSQFEYYSMLNNYYASMYGIDADTFAQYSGYTTSEEYAQHNAEEELKHTMTISKVAEDLGISFTDEEVDEKLLEYMEDQGVTDEYTLEEFKEENGETWMYTFRNYTILRDPVLDALKDRVVIVEEPETEAETEEAADAEGSEEATADAESESESE